MPIFTIPIHESNDCHTPAGSSAGGQFCGPGYLRGEHARARKAGVTFSVNPKVRVRDSAYYHANDWMISRSQAAKQPQIEIGTAQDEWKLGRAGILSIARHELGHVATPRQTRAQGIIDGFAFGSEYAGEFAAWQAAVGAAKGKIQWSTVRKSLTGYLADDARLWQKVKPQFAHIVDEDARAAAADRAYDAILDRHITILKRYARRVRGR